MTGIDILELRGRLRAAVAGGCVRFRSVDLEDGKPLPHKCRENVAAWVAEHPGDKAVGGWLVSSGSLLQKHFIVRGANGELFDITPLRTPTPFIVHPGRDNEFSKLPEEINLSLPDSTF